VSMQERSTVCAKRTIGSDWMCPMVLLGDKAHVEAPFGLFGDSGNPDAR
jgi:ferredoxin-NADP reductase